MSQHKSFISAENMTNSTSTLFWIAHSCILFRSIALICFVAVSRDKLNTFYTDHVDLINESLLSLVLAALELAGFFITAIFLYKHNINNLRLKVTLLICLVADVSSQCYLLVDIVAKAKQNTNPNDKYVDLFTINLYRLGVFAALTSFQAIVYIILYGQNEARRCKATKQMTYTKITLNPKDFIVNGSYQEKLSSIDV